MAVKTDLKTIATDLLTKGKVDVFIGYEAGSLPLSATPLILHADKSAPVSAGEAPRGTCLGGADRQSRKHSGVS